MTSNRHPKNNTQNLIIKPSGKIQPTILKTPRIKAKQQIQCVNFTKKEQKQSFEKKKVV